MRRIGIAFVSLVAAWLVVGWASGFLFSWLGFVPTATPTIPEPGAPMLLALTGIVLTLVLGRLIYGSLVRNVR